MGHDMELKYSVNHCDKCNRSDNIMLEEYYISYNHSWAFYRYLDEYKGIKGLYDVSISALLPRLKKMSSGLVLLNKGDIQQHMYSYGNIISIEGREVRDDGWATTVYNAYMNVTHLINICEKYIIDYPTARWSGD